MMFEGSDVYRDPHKDWPRHLSSHTNYLGWFIIEIALNKPHDRDAVWIKPAIKVGCYKASLKDFWVVYHCKAQEIMIVNVDHIETVSLIYRLQAIKDISDENCWTRH